MLAFNESLSRADSGLMPAKRIVNPMTVSSFHESVYQVSFILAGGVVGYESSTAR